MKVTIINAGGNNDYIYGLATGLSCIKDLEIEIIDTDKSIGKLDIINNIRLLTFIENYGYKVSIYRKIKRLVFFYLRLIHYSITSDSKVFHIQWEFKFKFFDRLVLPLLYRLCGKKIVFTAHNVDAELRAGKSSVYNRTTLSFMYNRMDHIIAHTESIKRDLITSFAVPDYKISVVMHGINVKPSINLHTKESACELLGIPNHKKVLLTFGAIDRYKGIDLMIEALTFLPDFPEILLVVAGNSTKKMQYLKELRNIIQIHGLQERVRIEARWIEDDEVDAFFLATDCVVLPYRKIFQSGVPFLAYRFGLPVVATRVGGLPEVIVDGETGFICSPDSASIAKAVSDYFNSPLFLDLEETKKRIRSWANDVFSWHRIGEQTFRLYREIVKSES